MRMTEIGNDEITRLVRALAEDGDAAAAAVGLMVERLRRLEDEVRMGDADRQTLQRIMSGRRVLGDRADLGSAEPPGAAEQERGPGRAAAAPPGGAA